MSLAKNPKLKIYFDGLCPLCLTEINHYRKVDTAGLIQFVDISLPTFDAKAEGLDNDAVNRSFHAKTDDGQIITGVDAFVKIWQVLQIFSWLQYLARFPVTRPFFLMGYAVFARIRPFFRRSPDSLTKNCDSDRCKI